MDSCLRDIWFGAQIFSFASASWRSMFSLEHSLQHWYATSYGLPLALYHSSCSWDLNQGHFWVFGSTTFAAAGDSQCGMCARCLFCPGRFGPANRTCRVPALSANGWGGLDLLRFGRIWIGYKVMNHERGWCNPTYPLEWFWKLVDWQIFLAND